MVVKSMSMPHLIAAAATAATQENSTTLVAGDVYQIPAGPP